VPSVKRALECVKKIIRHTHLCMRQTSQTSAERSCVIEARGIINVRVKWTRAEAAGQKQQSKNRAEGGQTCRHECQRPCTCTQESTRSTVSASSWLVVRRTERCIAQTKFYCTYTHTQTRNYCSRVVSSAMFRREEKKRWNFDTFTTVLSSALALSINNKQPLGISSLFCRATQCM
jgi:hypothetical protein